MFPPERIVPLPEEYDAAACDYQAAHAYSRMCKEMHQYGTLTGIHERAQVPEVETAER
jgi:hypothetical protein